MRRTQGPRPVRMIGRLVRIGVVFAAACASMPSATAFVTEGGIVWQNSTTTFNFFLGQAYLIESTDLALAMGDWNAATTVFKFNAVGNQSDPCDSTQLNGAAMSSTVCGDAFGANVLAVTVISRTADLRYFRHAGVLFNTRINFTSYDGPLRTNTIDLQRVAVHELGHVLGLDHQTDPTIPAIMAPDVSDISRPTADDIAGVQALYGNLTGGQTSIVSAVLPSSRSVRVGTTATAFATIVNAGAQPATGCSITLATPIAATSSYQITNATTNQATGTPNTPVDIPAGKAQSFIIGVTPTAAFSATDVAFSMRCATAPAATITIGLNTLLLSASNSPVPDIVALSATAKNDGYVSVGINGGSGAFAVATVNVGIGGDIVASVDTGSAVLPISVGLCQTNPKTGQCISAVGTTVSTTIGARETPTFAVFVGSPSIFAPDPAKKRVFVRFRDSSGVTRGATSVAVTSFD